jgi:hypothetical protein
VQRKGYGIAAFFSSGVVYGLERFGVLDRFWTMRMELSVDTLSGQEYVKLMCGVEQTIEGYDVQQKVLS